MKKFLTTAAAILMLAAPVTEAMAQGWNNNNRGDRYNDRRGQQTMQMRDRDNSHRNWRKGGRIDRHDWNRGRRIADYRRYKLQRPPRGYEWRQVDNNFVLAAAATGLIAALVIAGSR